jgi:hypothetical protein
MGDPPHPNQGAVSPEQVQLGPRSLPWYQPTGADLVFLILAVLIVQTAKGSMLDDPGLGWHLRNIDAMLEQGTWLREDPFTYSPDGHARVWYANQWLGEVPFWLGERWAGLEGIATVATLVLALMLRCLYRMLLRDGLPWPGAAAWTALAAMGTSCSWVARPNLFTVFFAMIAARICERFHTGALSRKATLWLIPLFAVWANVHGGFVGGFVILGATIAGEVATALVAANGAARSEAWKRTGHLALLVVGGFAATLVNPYGISLYHWVLQLLGNPYFMDLHEEWRSPDFHARGALRFEWLMLLFPLLVGLSRRRPNLVELWLSLVWLHLALSGFRYVAIWVVITTPLLARSSAGLPWFQDLARTVRGSAPESALFRVDPGGRCAWIWSVAIASCLFLWAKAGQGSFAYHKSEMVPVVALDRLLDLQAHWHREQGRRPVIFHSYNWGGFLIWHGWPNVRDWIDDRNEVQGEEHIREYFAVIEAAPGWRKRLAEVDLVAIPPDVPLAYHLLVEAGWSAVYRDQFAILFRRWPGLALRTKAP